MAGQIPQTFIDELLSRVDIVDVIDQRVTLKKAGRDYKACCPFHNEKTPSFTVSQSKQFYHCFGCGANGSAIGFLMHYDNMHFVDAVETLADSMGMQVPSSPAMEQARDTSKPLYALLESVAGFYRQALKEHAPATDYLSDRGLNAATCTRYGIGYAPEGWDALQRAFPDHEAALIKTGMLKFRDQQNTGHRRGARPYQRFRDRIMFPIRDRRGRVIAFGGRVLSAGEPKYLNSPETPLFHKGSELYGLFEARKAARDAGRVLVVEGYMDVIALARHGIDNAVATLGTAINRQHIETLYRVVNELVFCFDGDRAGREAAWRALKATLPCLSDGRDASFLFLPESEDPDTLVREQGGAGFERLLASRMPVIEFLFAHLAAGVALDSVGGKAQLADKARPLLGSIPGTIFRQLAFRRLETLIDLPLGTDSTPPKMRRGPPRPHPEPRQLTPMSRAVMLILQKPSIVADLPAEAFDFDPELPGAKILMRLIGYCDKDPTVSTARLLERFRDSAEYAHLARLAAKSFFPDGRELDSDTALIELAHCIERLCTDSQHRQAELVDTRARRGLLAIRRRR